MPKIIQFYTPRGLRVERAEGQYIWDKEGRRYLDCHNEYGVAFLGHRNPRILRYLREQLEKIFVASPAFDSDIKEKALQLLEKVLPKNLQYFYMLNGGSEAVELALKAARKLTGRKKFISFINAFHGRTMGALAMTWNPRYREGYDPFPWNVKFLPYNSVEAVEKEVDEETAAVVVEVIQGEGGLNEASPEFLKAIREACDKTGAQMIVDEVQTGFGRTGYLWAHQFAGVEPDMMTVGKAVGGGFPVSFAAMREEFGGKLKEGDHGSTFGGNPLACAALAGGIEELFENRVVEKAAETGKLLRNVLEKIGKEYEKVARGVKGRGLMIGLDLKFNPKPVIQYLQENGVIALKAGETVTRFLPPYMITREDIELIDRALRRALERFGKEVEKGRPRG